MYGNPYGMYGDMSQMGQMGYDPNMMMQQYGNMQQMNMQQQPQQTTEKPKSTGIPGLGNKAAKKQTTQPQQQTNTGTNMNLNSQFSNQQQPNVVTTNKTVDNKLKQQPTTGTKPTTTTAQPKKEEPKKTDAKKDTTTTNVKKDEVKEVTKKVDEIKIESEIQLVDDAKEGTMTEVDQTKKPVTIVFIGHVDHGKSTIAGNILYKTGQIDERTIEKYQREAKANNRESWFIAYIFDINDEERERGKTVEVGKAFFTTTNKRFTILDAPGHKGFVPNMIQGACQADYAGLVISAKLGEFESGFEGEGRTREHAILAKSLGVSKLVCIINKMDDDTVKWSQSRFEQIKKDVSVYLKSIGFKEKDIMWIPMSGLTGENLMEPVSTHKCNWYNGPPLLDLLDTIELPVRHENGPVRIPILDRYKEGGLHLLGKLESGTLKYGEKYIIMPTKIPFEVAWLFNSEEKGVPYAMPGENVRIKAKGIENESDVQRGQVICSIDDVCPYFSVFEAEIQIIDIPETKKIIATGYQCYIHMHTIIDECTLELMAEIDKDKNEKKTKFVLPKSRAKVRITTNNIVVGEKFEKFSALGRFILRDEGM
jgi:peptide chain release factor subunit 3